jgi:hypothetical protein
MTYQVLSVHDEETNDYFWTVYETATEQLIRTFFFQDDAQEYAEFLDSGGAFAGFTPAFVLREVAVNRDINSEFSAEFS